MNTEVINPSILLDSSNEMEFLQLAKFDAGHSGAFWSNPGGPSPWEMHPDCDELLHVIEGKIEIEILPEKSGDSETFTLTAGTFLVVPKGCWHRQNIIEKSKEYYVTPGPTLHSYGADPRLDDPDN